MHTVWPQQDDLQVLHIMRFQEGTFSTMHHLITTSDCDMPVTGEGSSLLPRDLFRCAQMAHMEERHQGRCGQGHCRGPRARLLPRGCALQVLELGMPGQVGAPSAAGRPASHELLHIPGSPSTQARDGHLITCVSKTADEEFAPQQVSYGCPAAQQYRCLT